MTATTTPETVELPPPENENVLMGLAKPELSQVLALSGADDVSYGELRWLRTHTAQSDFLKLQFRGIASCRERIWQALEGDESRWHATLNSAQVQVDHPSRTVYFGPKGGVRCSGDLPERGLTDFLFAQIIQWTKAAYPDYAVHPGLLHPGEVPNEDARQRRNGFLAQQGFDLEWFDGEQKSGRYGKERVDKLSGSWDNGKIHVVDGLTLLDAVSRQDEEILRLGGQLQDAEHRHLVLEARLARERNTNLILTGVTCFILVLVLMGALGLY